MESDTNIHEITSKIANKEYVRNDMIEITNIVRKILNEKYISKMNELFSQHQEMVINNPTKEVMLMQAIKPFMKKEAQLNIDKMIQIINIMNTAKNLQQELVKARAQNSNEISEYNALETKELSSK